MKLFLLIIFFILINGCIFAQSNEEIETDDVFRVIDISDYLANLRQNNDTLFIYRDTVIYDTINNKKVIIDKWDSEVMEAKLDEIQRLIKEQRKDW